MFSCISILVNESLLRLFFQQALQAEGFSIRILQFGEQELHMNVIMLNVIMLNVIMLNVSMLNFIMLNFIMLNDNVPKIIMLNAMITLPPLS
jgi:hypothetical protein